MGDSGKVAIEKICVVCGQDVAGIPQTKDQAGRYYCNSCWASNGSAPHEPGPLKSLPQNFADLACVSCGSTSVTLSPDRQRAKCTDCGQVFVPGEQPMMQPAPATSDNQLVELAQASSSRTAKSKPLPPRMPSSQPASLKKKIGVGVAILFGFYCVVAVLVPAMNHAGRSRGPSDDQVKGAAMNYITRNVANDADQAKGDIVISPDDTDVSSAGDTQWIVKGVLHRSGNQVFGGVRYFWSCQVKFSEGTWAVSDYKETFDDSRTK